MKAYSLDLRERVAVAYGQTGRQVAVRFSVCAQWPAQNKPGASNHPWADSPPVPAL